MANYIDFLFEDLESGEMFFVELKTDGKTAKELKREAIKIAEDNFIAPVSRGIYDPDSAERLGYDTY